VLLFKQKGDHICQIDCLKIVQASLQLVFKWRSATQCYNLLLQFEHSLKLALDKIKLSLHMLQCKQAPLLVFSVTAHVKYNAHRFHSLCTNAGTTALELMHMCIHLLEVHWRLLPVTQAMMVSFDQQERLGIKARSV
jgi:hypothetical protein